MTKDPKTINIAICGAAEIVHCGLSIIDTALTLGRALAKQNVILANGATSGFPEYVLQGFKEVGGVSIGLSPAANKAEHINIYRLPTDNLDHIIYTGFGYPGRDLMLVRSADAVIFGCGRIGTIHEFTVAFESQIPIGVLEGEWQTDEVIKNIIESSDRQNCKIIYSSDPEELARLLVEAVKNPNVCPPIVGETTNLSLR